MIIDEILNRKEGEQYSPKEFYLYCLGYNADGDRISEAMDYGTEADVKKALCDYIEKSGYNPQICDYVNRVNWITVN